MPELPQIAVSICAGFKTKLVMSEEQKNKGFKSVKITFTDLEMSGETLVKFLEIIKETEPETYDELKKQLLETLAEYFKDNGITA